MTIHMKSLGITVEEIGIIYGVVPFFAVLAPSVMGIIADKLGNFKVSRPKGDIEFRAFYFHLPAQFITFTLYQKNSFSNI